MSEKKRKSAKQQEGGDAVNIFVSYSHEDKLFHDALVKHAAVLKAGGVTLLHDCDIPPTKIIPDQISEQILTADIFLPLVSSDYFSSTWCMKELSLATKHKKPLLSVIARDCGWESDKRLKDPRAARNGNPITDPGNDAAWKEVVRDIEAAVKSALSDRAQKNFTVKNAFLTKMSEIRHPFFTKRRDKLHLEQIFVFPELQEVPTYKKADSNERRVKSEFLLDLQKWDGVVTIGGKLMSGKTALAQRVFSELAGKECYPLIVRGGDLNQPSPLSVLKKACKSQYNEHELFWEPANISSRVLIIDDYHKSRILASKKRMLLQKLRSQFPRILIFVNEFYTIDEMLTQETPGELITSSEYRILEMGSHLRSVLIEKWVSANEPGLVPAPTDNVRMDADRIKKSVDTILGRGDSVPRHPFFILGTIQKMEILGDYPGEPVTLFGHCYHAIITASLWKAEIEQSDAHAYFNFLTHLAGRMHMDNIDGVSPEWLLHFMDKEYNFLMPASPDAMLVKLRNAEIIRNQDGYYVFCYDYMRCFFTAKKIADEINASGKAEIIDDLCRTVETEQSRHILLFIIYHTKSPVVMTKILSFVKKLVSDHTPASMQAKELWAFKGFHMPKDFFRVHSGVEENRAAKHNVEDIQEKNEAKWRKEVEADNSNNRNDGEHRKDQVEFSHVLTALEVIGQILRNHYGDLDKEQLFAFYNEAQLAGLRMLGKFIKTFDSYKSEFREGIVKILEDMKVPEAKREEKAKLFMGLFFSSALHFVLEKIAKEIGSSKILPISEKARNANQETDGENTPSTDLIYTNVKMWNPSNPQQSTQDAKAIANLIEDIASSLEKNQIAKSVLIMMVMDYIAIYDLPVAVKQQIASALNIRITAMQKPPKFPK